VQKVLITPLCTDVLEASIKTQQDKLLAIHAPQVTTALRHPFIQLYVHKDFIALQGQATRSSAPWALLVVNWDSHRQQTVISVCQEHIVLNKEFHRLMDYVIQASIA